MIDGFGDYVCGVDEKNWYFFIVASPEAKYIIVESPKENVHSYIQLSIQLRVDTLLHWLHRDASRK